MDWMLFRMVKTMHMQITARDLEDIVARYNHKPDASCSSWWGKRRLKHLHNAKTPGVTKWCISKLFGNFRKQKNIMHVARSFIHTVLSHKEC